VFLEIEMPGRNGIDVAEAAAADWPDGYAEPLFFFVTAFDEFAVSAFELSAIRDENGTAWPRAACSGR
jgi:DNA-binding LytR/AlgR family response regulator